MLFLLLVVVVGQVVGQVRSASGCDAAASMAAWLRLEPACGRRGGGWCLKSVFWLLEECFLVVGGCLNGL